MTPYVSGRQDASLQNPGKTSYKDLHPPLGVDLYYAVTIVDGEGQQETLVDARKVKRLFWNTLRANLINGAVIKIITNRDDNYIKSFSWTLQIFIFVWRSWEDEKASFSIHYRAQTSLLFHLHAWRFWLILAVCGVHVLVKDGRCSLL